MAPLAEPETLTSHTLSGWMDLPARASGGRGSRGASCSASPRSRLAGRSCRMRIAPATSRACSPMWGRRCCSSGSSCCSSAGSSTRRCAPFGTRRRGASSRSRRLRRADARPRGAAPHELGIGGRRGRSAPDFGRVLPPHRRRRGRRRRAGLTAHWSEKASVRTTSNSPDLQRKMLISVSMTPSLPGGRAGADYAPNTCAAYQRPSEPWTAPTPSRR